MLARVAPRLLAATSTTLAPLTRPTTLRCMSSVGELVSVLEDEIDFEVRPPHIGQRG